jgi:hypothetical protein
MEAGLRTPLLDLFRRGDLAHDVRLLAAQGAIAPRPLEQLGILALLTTDHDAEVRATAEATLARIPTDLLSGFIANSDVPLELREFFVKRGIDVAAVPIPVEEPFVDEDDTDYGGENVSEDAKLGIVQRLAAMTVPEKVKAAMKGSREMRAILVRDSNKMVALAVLASPKLTEAEVEAICRMGSVGEDVLRTIGHTRAWTKAYGVVRALVKNSKTPVAMSLTLLSRLTEKDIRAVSIDRNVPDPLRIAARRKVVMDK